jgi:4-diphosphocytidyl-2-C-methyl-D-erythritol kinase
MGVVIFPNCKINLGLFVTGKREDGFHQLETILVPAPLIDCIEILPRTDSQFTLRTFQSKYSESIETHSCYKAWKTLHNQFGIPGVDLYLLKNIPTGGGLGGGSADSAFTMMALNDLFGLGLKQEELVQLTGRIGSDDPFFIFNKPCYLNGRGPELIEYPQLAMNFDIVIKSTSVFISTREAFSYITPRRAPVDLRQLHQVPKSNWRSFLSNDFQEGAVKAYPLIQHEIDRLYSEGAFYAAMSGSGSSVFGLFEKTS